LSLCHFDRRAAEWPEVEKSIKQKNSRLRFVMLEIDLFLLDRNDYRLINYILINFEGNNLSGQLDSLDLAAGNAAVVLVPNNGGWRI